MPDMKNKNGKHNLDFNIIKSGSLLICMGIMLIFSAIAWFGMNNEVVSNNMSLSGEKAEVQFDATVYRYVRQPNDSFLLDSFTSSGVEHLMPQLALNEYDVMFQDENIYTPLVMRLGLTGIRLPRTGTITVTIRRNNNPLIVNGKIQPYFTAVTNYVCAIDSSFYSNTVSNIYNSAVNGMKNMTASKFISANDVTTDNLTFNIPYTSSDFNGSVLNVYILIRYEESYADRFVKESLDNNTELITNFDMTNDISVITVDYAE